MGFNAQVETPVPTSTPAPGKAVTVSWDRERHELNIIIRFVIWVNLRLGATQNALWWGGKDHDGFLGHRNPFNWFPWPWSEFSHTRARPSHRTLVKALGDLTLQYTALWAKTSGQEAQPGEKVTSGHKGRYEWVRVDAYSGEHAGEKFTAHTNRLGEPTKLSGVPWWNGEPCQARRGTGIVLDDPLFPLFWARHLVGQRVPVVRVKYGNQGFTLYDEGDAGWNKLIGGGSHRVQHSRLDVADFEPSGPWVG